MSDERQVDKRSYEGTVPTRDIPVPADTGPAGGERAVINDARVLRTRVRALGRHRGQLWAEVIDLKDKNRELQADNRRLRWWIKVILALAVADLVLTVASAVR